jgi:ribosomal protein L23
VPAERRAKSPRQHAAADQAERARAAANRVHRAGARTCQTRPQAEIKPFIEAVYGMQVERVSTINYQGKKKTQIDSQGSPHYYRCVCVLGGGGG